MSDQTPAPGSALHPHPHQPPTYRVQLPLLGLPSGQTQARGLPLRLLEQSAAEHSPPPAVSARVLTLPLLAVEIVISEPSEHPVLVTFTSASGSAPPICSTSAWANYYVILETKGRGHYLGCNLSVTNI